MFADSGLAVTILQDPKSKVLPICLAWNNLIQLPKEIFVSSESIIFNTSFSIKKNNRFSN
jgi:hypothetical protein